MATRWKAQPHPRALVGKSRLCARTHLCLLSVTLCSILQTFTCGHKQLRETMWEYCDRVPRPKDDMTPAEQEQIDGDHVTPILKALETTMKAYNGFIRAKESGKFNATQNETSDEIISHLDRLYRESLPYRAGILRQLIHARNKIEPDVDDGSAIEFGPDEESVSPGSVNEEHYDVWYEPMEMLSKLIESIEIKNMTWATSPKSHVPVCEPRGILLEMIATTMPASTEEFGKVWNRDYIQALGIVFENQWLDNTGIPATYVAFRSGDRWCIGGSRARSGNLYYARKEQELRNANVLQQPFAKMMESANKGLRIQEKKGFEYRNDAKERQELMRQNRTKLDSQCKGLKEDILRHPEVTIFPFDSPMKKKPACWRCKALHGFKEPDGWGEYDELSFR